MADTSAKQWIDRQLGWSGIAETLAARPVPARNPAFYIGGIAFFCLSVQIATGILLMLHYEPGVATAHASTLKIIGQVPFGDVIRGVHVWSADLFVGVVGLHLISVMVRRSFVAPRELSWMSGMALLVAGVGMAFTGLILPWSQKSVFQARISSEFVGKIPLIGEWLKQLLRGGEELTPATLQHAFGFHVAVLPAAITVIFLFHLISLRQPGKVSDKGPTIPVYPDFLVRMAAVWLGLFIIILSLALFVERPLGVPADLTAAAPNDALPPWYFLFAHELMRVAPAELVGVESARFIVSIGALLFLVLLFLPFLDRRGSRFTAGVAIGLALFILVMTVYGLA